MSAIDSHKYAVASAGLACFEGLYRIEVCNRILVLCTYTSKRSLPDLFRNTPHEQTGEPQKQQHD